ncbi:MAG: enhanced serine sensitivity protein SseB [Saccharofermentans sp.]|nr:enhanced serine sensitivity protein SseB [Saccharofermentans sp.]
MESNKIDRINNTELVSLLDKVRQDPSEQNMLELLKCAAGATFLVPVSGTEGNYSFHAISGQGSARYIVVYSDSDSFEKAHKGKQQGGVLAGFEDLMDVVLEEKMKLNGFVINPGMQEVLFGEEMLTMIKNQMADPADETAKVGEPDHYPPQLKEKLDEYIASQDKVSAIWVRLLLANGTGIHKWLLVIDTDLEGEELRYEADNLSNYLKPYLDGLDAMIVSLAEEFAKRVTEGVKPFSAKPEV